MNTAMHEFGLAHSVSAYDRATGELVGGLYGLAVGGCFSGESMFHRVPNASMVCLAELTQRLFAAGFLLHDCQQMTPHVERCGAREVPQAWFVRQMTALVAVQPDWAKVSREDGPDASSPTE
jgi:leucyl/phenylalanyl-tRNA--protein transferase